MAVSEIHLSNRNVLQKATSATVIFPEGQPGPFPVFYLLHGLSDDHTMWTRRTQLESYVEDLPLIVVMPDGERSFYTDAKTNPRGAFETFLVRDLIGFVDAAFRTIPDRSGRVIDGLSMGGYGALKLALKHPGLFRAAASHSGAVAFANRTWADEEDGEWKAEFEPIFGERPADGDDDIFGLVQRLDLSTQPALRFDCGVDDELIEHNRRLDGWMAMLGVEHEYEEFPGGHTWEYWDEHIQDALAFFSRELGLVRRE